MVVREKYDDKRRVLLDCECTNQDGKTVLKGEAEVIAPSEKIHRSRSNAPSVTLGGLPFALLS
ncbi:MAG: hypothetical protein CGU28_13140 [Candidatus Dactylopiibacterium carminicum]|uniref:MaoC-like domain-containing protein n=1 Tax=Candidatus Dactylopiibacterium carminicum TaxID=857335 RepID=A0A272EPB7_9RHOO|nr:hypothetical protein [Candidatus Dactylopiibacterium carminicum]KAF7598296.1 hypothetical protein BGI27_14195 [Candidatus Dactylopiibacterium carminicum]PAS91906.1 MAG: hypothetical protein CGU29_13830 [Candidatus Dactylopiibacterium carminicum]PAS94962.1 MAG: hypothetical protein CGU28_13140 [Candidatus Dactylopiibacterium carminicum]PAS97228.1 MAG: hypothetical protein BSR46_14225 [Candidatus Dactylopiibacterium carminicum]